jgi:hypothetical protein
MISSYPPRLCGIGTFIEEARELIRGGWLFTTKRIPGSQAHWLPRRTGAGILKEKHDVERFR